MTPPLQKHIPSFSLLLWVSNYSPLHCERTLWEKCLKETFSWEIICWTPRSTGLRRLNYSPIDCSSWIEDPNYKGPTTMTVVLTLYLIICRVLFFFQSAAFASSSSIYERFRCKNNFSMSSKGTPFVSGRFR